MLRIEQYQLVFIGQIGAGKTTAICHLLNLVYERTVTRQTRVKGQVTKTKTVTVTSELLTTGSGRTTICEVVIQPAAQTALEIVPHEPDELKKKIEDFCVYIWARAYPSDSASAADAPELKPSDELLRAIRNVTGLPETTAKTAKEGEPLDQIDALADELEGKREGDSGAAKSERSKLVDTALEHAKQFQPDQYDVFVADVLDRAQIDQRTATHIAYPAGAEETEAEWLRKTFADINLGRNPAF